MRKAFLETFYRLAATGLLPRSLFAPPLPTTPPPPPAGGAPLRIEVVSHCWNYAYLLGYQLSSLVQHPVEGAEITMTVFHAPEDEPTVELLRFFGTFEVPGIHWRWRSLPRESLFRRAIGRNLAAKETEADWIWFADCDLIFHAGALTGAAALLRGRTDPLVFPRFYGVTDLLPADHPLLVAGRGAPKLLEVDPSDFHPHPQEKAIGGFQIFRGDVARAVGYCGTIPFYQEPLPRWQKTYEDRTVRWLIGTHGTPLDLPALYRIRHQVKGRKTG